MDTSGTVGFDIYEVPSPSFVVDRDLINRNLEILNSVQLRTDAKILLALKGFAMFSLFPFISKYLHGVCASSPHEARLGREKFGREVHVFAPAYSETDFNELAGLCDHIVFNSYSQFERFKSRAEKLIPGTTFGLRVNPEHSEAPVALYDPCAPFSRLGIPVSKLTWPLDPVITGIHFHALCEQNADALERTLNALEDACGNKLSSLRWINFGGGHHITRDDYDIDLLCNLITRFKDRYNLDVYLEPGEAVALNTGYLVATVLDVVNNGMDIAILDTSAVAHMVDVIEMPYRPYVIGSGMPGEKPYTVRLGGLSCLAGDIIGDYSFERPLRQGDRIVFTDMAHYTMVKTNTFNGLKLPSIVIFSPEDNSTQLVRSFGYEDFAGRLS